MASRQNPARLTWADVGKQRGAKEALQEWESIAALVHYCPTAAPPLFCLSTLLAWHTNLVRLAPVSIFKTLIHLIRLALFSIKPPLAVSVHSLANIIHPLYSGLTITVAAASEAAAAAIIIWLPLLALIINFFHLPLSASEIDRSQLIVVESAWRGRAPATSPALASTGAQCSL